MDQFNKKYLQQPNIHEKQKFCSFAGATKRHKMSISLWQRLTSSLLSSSMLSGSFLCARIRMKGFIFSTEKFVFIPRSSNTDNRVQQENTLARLHVKVMCYLACFSAFLCSISTVFQRISHIYGTMQWVAQTN